MKLNAADRTLPMFADPGRQEYLRRNLVVCSAVGAEWYIRNAIARLNKTKSPPKWLMDSLRNALIRIEKTPVELAAYRDEIE